MLHEVSIKWMPLGTVATYSGGGKRHLEACSPLTEKSKVAKVAKNHIDSVILEDRIVLKTVTESSE